MNGGSVVEWGFLITAILFLLNLITTSRNWKKDTKAEEADHTTVLMKLEIIQTGINELKTDIKSVKEDIKDIDKRLTIQEQSLKAAWKQIDSNKDKKAGDS